MITSANETQYNIHTQPGQHQLKVDREISQLAQTSHSTQQQTSASKEDLVEPVQQVNEALNPHGVQFEVQDQDGSVVVKVVDQESGDVIRQIPSEEALAVAERLDELTGRLFNQEA